MATITAVFIDRSMPQPKEPHPMMDTRRLQNAPRELHVWALSIAPCGMATLARLGYGVTAAHSPESEGRL